MGNFICHIKAKSINIIFLHPFFADIYDIFANFRIIRIQLWHSICKGKRIELSLTCIAFCVPHGWLFKIKVIDHEPGSIFAFLPVFPDILPKFISPSTMIENAIQNNADSSFMSFLNKFLHSFAVAKGSVYHFVISCIIFVLRRRFIDRSQIKT